jgi:hypothetical protein
MSFLGIFFIVLCIGIVITLIVLAITQNKTSDTKATGKTLFKLCKNTLDCETGFVCELRDHPSDGICVIPPGGACHKVVGNKNSSCYSGYYCDTQDGVCYKNE